MCCIAGILTRSIDPVASQEAIHRMVEKGWHRGPDAKGFQTIIGSGGSLFLGHARLSIIDLTQASNQPMQDVATGSWLIYNGEIYNFRQLREELKGEGLVFSSRGDTEVLLKALVHWGEEALNRIRGMYAFAFWDGLKKELTLARDPLGIKPLYYSYVPGTFVFGSEVKVIQASRLMDFSLNKDALKSYLVYGAVIRPLTILNEIKELPPGHVLKVSQEANTLSLRQYWSLSEDIPESRQDKDFLESVSSLKSSLERTVKSHLVSDVPLGIFLSGGIDSSLLTLLASQQNGDLNLLTVDIAEDGFSELKYARLIAQEIQRKHEVIFLTPHEMLNSLPGALSVMDQPTVDGINTYIISKAAASSGIKVLLSGVGGDELFASYTTFRNIPLMVKHRLSLFRLARLMLKVITPGKDMRSWHKAAQLNKSYGFKECCLLHRCIRWKDAEGGLDSGDAPPDNFALSSDINEELESISTGAGDDFRKIACLELSLYLQNQLLRDSDVFSMANSIELRLPFLDLEVVKNALTLPGNYHMNYRQGKRILRTMLRAIYPQMPLDRKKKGFILPWEYWLHSSLKEMVFDKLHKAALYKNVGLDFKQGKKVFEDFLKHNPLVSWYQVWSLFVLLDWQERNKVTI